MMKEIMTVLGPIAPNQLGFTSMHEHILADVGFYAKEAEEAVPTIDKIFFPAKPDEPVKIENLSFLNHGFFSISKDNTSLIDEELMNAEVKDFNLAGGSAILELSIPGIRGDVEGLRRISEKTGVHIVASTGLYAEESWPAKYLEMSVDDFSNYMKNEVEQGIEGTSVRAGHLKFAPNSLSSRSEKMVRAIARTSMDTGLAATLHQGLQMTKDDGRKMAKMLIEEGADPQRIVFAHMDKLTFNYPESFLLNNYLLDPNSRRLDLEYAKELLDLGFTLSFDTFGHNWNLEPIGLLNQTDYERLAGLVALIKEGYSKQLVIGCDVFTKMLTRRYGGDGYSRILNFVVPALRNIGTPEVDIQNITVENPARLLAR